MATILVVDDEPDIRALVQLNLELDSHQVVTAANGAEALELVHTELPDLVLLDLNMPEVDGWQVLEQIKAAGDADISTIPVLMLTADDTADNRVRGGIEGAIRYLRKPFSPAALRAEVAEALTKDEPTERRRTQRRALEQLVRMEGGNEAVAPAGVVRPRLTRLERRQEVATVPRPGADARTRLDALTDKQRMLLEALASAASVSDAALGLGVSRSNVYASLRRISRKLGIASVPDLLALVRDGLLDAD